MVAPSPTLETVITAIETALDAISPNIGDVETGLYTLEDQIEFIVNGSYLSSGSMDLWMIDLESTEPVEGEAAGEDYDLRRILINYWSIRTNDAGWSKAARQKMEAVRDDLTGKAAIFAISGQRQLIAPEQVEILEHGPFDLPGTEDTQMVYRGVLALTSEARRWS